MRRSLAFLIAATSAACARLASAQTIDAFNPLPNGEPEAVAIQPDGKILIGDNFSHVAGTARQGVARLDVDGSVDTTFADPQANFEVIAIAVQLDGKVLVGGEFDSIGGGARHHLARLNANGTLDASFADPGLDGEVWSIVVQPDGKVLAAGGFQHVGDAAQSYLARFNANGTLDTSFANPQLCCLDARALALQADGRVVVGGYFSQAGGASHFYLARYSAGGVLDAAFPATGANSAVTALAIGPDGAVYTNGGYSTSDSANLRLVTKLSANGTLAGTYDDLHSDGAANTFVLQPNGKVLVGGTFQHIDGQPRHALARLNADGSLDSTFHDLAFSFSATNPNGSIFALAAQADGKLLAFGNFTLVNGQSRQTAARAVTGDAAASRLAGQASGSNVVATWTRSGDGPELAQPPTLMHSSDGATFTAAGPMTRTANGWRATAAFNVHGAPFYLQASGMTGGGETNGSSGRVGSNVWFSDTIFADGFD